MLIPIATDLSHRCREWMLRACLLCAFSLSPGCQTEKTMTRPGDPLPPPPVEGRATPQDSMITDIVVLAPYSLSDLDGNGFASEFPIAVYLYSKPFPLPFWKAGSIRVEIFDETPEGPRALLDRVYGSDQLVESMQTNVVGDFYALQLTLSESAVRELSNGQASFRVVFESRADETTITSSVKRINVR